MKDFVFIITLILTMIIGELSLRSQRVTSYFANPQINLDGINPYWKVKMVEEKGGGNIIFLGSSRVRHDINPLIVEKLTKKSVYNLGSIANSPLSSFYQLQKVWEFSKKPSIVIYGTSEFELNKNVPMNLIEGRRQFTVFTTEPSIASYKILLNSLNGSDNNTVLNRFFSTTSQSVNIGPTIKKIYRQSIINIAKSFISGNPFTSAVRTSLMPPQNTIQEAIGKDEYNNNGFLALDFTLNNEIMRTASTHWRYNLQNYDLDPVESNALEEIVDFCKENKIKLYLVNMPVHSSHKLLYKNGDETKYLTFIKNLAKKNNVPLITLDKLKFEDTDFADTNHLNGKGAEKLSVYLANIIK